MPESNIPGARRYASPHAITTKTAVNPAGATLAQSAYGSSGFLRGSIPMPLTALSEPRASSRRAMLSGRLHSLAV